MIQYPISLRELARVVSRRFPTSRNRSGAPRRGGRIAWRERARHLTERIRILHAYTAGDSDEIWRELKPLFAELQGDGKCAFCEKRLDLRKSGRSSGDIEHYRPKKGVEAWSTHHPITVGASETRCYYLLAFHLRNYLLACEICNQDYKGNFFPIAGPRCPADSPLPRYLIAERPYLPHPLDPNDEDPEQLIEFVGVTPIPRSEHGTHSYWRAIVTIELLGLTGGTRFDLDYERALVIANLYQALISANPVDPVAQWTIRGLLDNTQPHRNCARSFKRLFDLNRNTAALAAEQAVTYVESVQKRRTKPM